MTKKCVSIYCHKHVKIAAKSPFCWKFDYKMELVKDESKLPKNVRKDYSHV